MSARAASIDAQAMRDMLSQRLGAEHVIADPDDLAFYSTDIYHHRALAELVARPGSVEEVRDAVRLCTENDRAVIARGGGLSYTGGYLPVRERSVILDMGRMDRILEINAEDLYVTVEPNVTWNALYHALKAQGLRTPFFGTASGFSATVGGSLSQNSSHFGVAEHGLSADSCLGLRVVLADGTVVTTGSGALKYAPSPFLRNYGPDLTGLFLGDTGALGIKVQATLRCIPFPEHQRHASFAFDTHDQMILAMGQVGRAGLAAECGGWDPGMVANYIRANPDLQQDLKYLSGVARSGANLLEGLKDAARIAVTGRRAFKDVAYLMHVTLDESSAPAADAKMTAVEAIAKAHGGTAVEPTFPRAHRAIPFNYPNGVLGPRGQRWVPTHGLAPHSRALAVSHGLFDYLEQRRGDMEAHGIEWVLIMSEVGARATLIEPMFYWPDQRSVFHERWIQKPVLDKMPDYPARPDVARTMHDIRIGVMDLFMRQGCVHLQIGKVYPYKQGVQESTYALLRGIKSVVDPKGLINPGSLGLD